VRLTPGLNAEALGFNLKEGTLSSGWGFDASETDDMADASLVAWFNTPMIDLVTDGRSESVPALFPALEDGVAAVYSSEPLRREHQT
jgi:hypothetical protein